MPDTQKPARPPVAPSPESTDPALDPSHHTVREPHAPSAPPMPPNAPVPHPDDSSGDSGRPLDRPVSPHDDPNP